MQQLLGVIPFVECGGRIETFVTLESNQPRLQGVSQCLRDLSFPDACWSFDQQRLAERHRQVQSRRYRGVGNVNLLFQHLLDLFDFCSQLSFPVFAAVTSRSKSSGVLMSSG